MVWDQSSESISEKDKLENKLKDIIPNNQISDITQDNNGYTLVFKTEIKYN